MRTVNYQRLVVDKLGTPAPGFRLRPQRQSGQPRQFTDGGPSIINLSSLVPTIFGREIGEQVSVR